MNDDSIDPKAVTAKDASRFTALKLLDYLEVFYGRLNPPVRDITALSLYRLEQQDLPEGSGVVLSPSGESWLTAELLPLPPIPRLPETLSTWVVGSVSPEAPPTLRNPDRIAARLIALSNESQASTLEVEDLDELDEHELAALGLEGVNPGEVTASTLEAIDAAENAERRLSRWVEGVWTPWSESWRRVQKGRIFYKSLYDLRDTLARDGDLYELVWGFALLRWKPQGRVEVRHPLFSAPMEVTLDEETGALAVSPTGSTELEIQWSMDLPLTDARGLSQRRDSYAAADLDPWTPEFLEEIPSLVRLIDLDTELNESPVAGMSQARVTPAHWTLYLRRRDTDYRGFLEAQRELYQDGDISIPDPFASLVMDEPSLLNTDGSFGDEDEQYRNDELVELLLPLPSNGEQERILRLAQHRAGVTAKGPPGTGKSHTIANLIAHFTANGQRVLVTAAKEQALQVLIDKVPEEIRALCVPIIGTDAAARNRLQHSIEHISGAAGAPSNRVDIERLKQRLQSIDENISANTNELARRRAVEAEPAPLRPQGFDGTWTPSKAAVWLNDNASSAGLIDAVDPKSTPPLNDVEYDDLLLLIATITEDDAQAAVKTLPSDDTLPTGHDLSGLWSEQQTITDLLAELNDWVTDWNLVDATDTTDWFHLADELSGRASWLAGTIDSWTSRVLSDASDSALVLRWTDFVGDATTEREHVIAATRELAAHSVEIAQYEEDPRQFLANLEATKIRFAEGKTVGFAQRTLRRTLQSCQVDGLTPRSVDELNLVLTELHRHNYRERLNTRWTNLAADFGLPPLPGIQPAEFEVGEVIERIAKVLEWDAVVRPGLAVSLEKHGLDPGDLNEPHRLADLSQAARNLRNRARAREIESRLTDLAAHLVSGMNETHASPLWRQLHAAITTQKVELWEEALAEIRRLVELRDLAFRRIELSDRFRSAVPLTSKAVVNGENPLSCGLAMSWRWRQLQVWLDALDAGLEPSELQERLEQLSLDRRNTITALVAARAWEAMSLSIDDRKRNALNQFTEANRRLGKGTGKYVNTWKNEIRKSLDNAKDAVPVWIMPIHKAISSFRPTPEPPFDVVIIDEASQVGLLELVVLGLARRAIVVGDEKQTSPANVGLNRQPLLDALDHHLGHLEDRYTRFNPDLSLYDIARQRFPDVVQLTEHFRCLPRIIEFSNHRWYDGSVVPLRDKPPHQGWEPLGSVFVPTGTRSEGRKDNPQEAQAIADLIAELTNDHRYDGLTFGVITLLTGGQGALITETLLDRFGPEFMERRQLRVADPAGFQGDERNVIIYSFVVAANRTTGPMTGEDAHRRINVAASRGTDQTWAVHSVPPGTFGEDDPRRWLLEYATTPFDEDQFTSNIDKTDSDFERQVLRAIDNMGYRRVFAQYPVGRFSIDIVIEGPESRLAVECDGDRWHGPDEWAKDHARQQILERAGWTFERIRGSAFYRNPMMALEPLWKRLNELGIPTGDWEAPVTTTVMHREWPKDFVTTAIVTQRESEEGSWSAADHLDSHDEVDLVEEFTLNETPHAAVPQEIRDQESAFSIGPIPLLTPDAANATIEIDTTEPASAQESPAAADSAQVVNQSDLTASSTPASLFTFEEVAPSAARLPLLPSTNKEIRRWARAAGLEVADKGLIAAEVLSAWLAAHPGRPLPDFYGPVEPSDPANIPMVPASNSEVRRWARARGLAVGERGPLHPNIVKAWSEAFPSRPVMT